MHLETVGDGGRISWCRIIYLPKCKLNLHKNFAILTGEAYIVDPDGVNSKILYTHIWVYNMFLSEERRENKVY